MFATLERRGPPDTTCLAARRDHQTLRAHRRTIRKGA